MENLIIQQSTHSNWEEYKGLRLSALKTEPQAFLSSYTKELTYPDEKWQERLQMANEGKTSWIYFAKVNGKLVGMIGGYRDENDLKNQTAQIWGVYVNLAERGKGIAKAFMAAILEKLSKNSDIKKVILEVNTDQEIAQKLYEKFGFVETETNFIQLGDGLTHKVSKMAKVM